MGSILGWLLFGFIVGLIARALMPGKDNIGLISTIGLGMLGAVLAGWFGRAVGWYGEGEGAGFVSATVGAVALLAIYNYAWRRPQQRKALGLPAHDRRDKAA